MMPQCLEQCLVLIVAVLMLVSCFADCQAIIQLVRLGLEGISDWLRVPPSQLWNGGTAAGQSDP